MPRQDPRINAYIAKSADFARPILNHLRRIIHAACPEMDETVKWSFPHFLHKGMVCSMAAFKQHCTFGFWKGDLIFGGEKSNGSAESGSHGQFGRITSLADLPADRVLIGYVRKAVQLNDDGIKLPARPRSRVKRELVVPDDLIAALKKNKRALATFEDFSYSHKKKYVEWITGAKREETRRERLTRATTWLAQGKSRHWKYSQC